VAPSSRENSVAGKHCHSKSLTQNALYDYEHMVFNPWNCLPGTCGSVNRMRLAVYLASWQVRQRLNLVGHEQ
jgi:hypothetical protein